MSTQRLPPEDIIGTVLNYKYQVLQRLSQGGMGVVYKAHHLMLDAPVALKILLKPESEEAQQRFLSEARLASKIHHPNTVYISDFGVLDDGRAFLEMEYLDGRTLGAELRKGPMPVLRACQIAMQMARGLQAVHDKGIIHRDMKPDNVFLMEQDGSKDFVKIVDFGIAKVAPRESPAGPRSRSRNKDGSEDPSAAADNFTEIGIIMGTPGFMSPEQIQGLPLSFAADQYALGCILYEMISGQRVFPTTDQQSLLMNHLTAEPTPLRERCPSAKVPKGIDALVLRLLAKDPAGRLGSMREVEQALEVELDLLLRARGQRRTGTHALAPVPRWQLLGLAVPRWGLVLLPAALVLLALGYGGVRYWARTQTESEKSSRLSQELLELRRRAIQVLLQDLHSGGPELRYSALAALGQAGDGELRSELEPVLASADLKLRAQAAAALGRLGDRRAIPALLPLLPDARPPAPPGSAQDQQHVRLAAAEALRRLGEPRGAQTLEQLLGGTDQDAQLRAALYFCAHGPPGVQRVLEAYLQRSGLPEATVLSILSCAARAGSRTAQQRLHAQLTEDGPPESQLAAAVKLALLGDTAGLAYLRELVARRGHDHLLAARELALLDLRDGLELLRQVADNRAAPSQVRQLACDGLGAIGEPQDARRLSALFADQEPRDPALRQAAAQAVVRITGRDPGFLSMQSLRWAQAALGDSDALVRQSAATILGDNLNAGAVSLLTGMLKDGDPAVRRSVVMALGRRRDEGAVRGLAGALQDPDQGVRLESLHALLRIGEALRAPALLRAAESLRSTLAALLAQSATPATLRERVLASSVLLRLGDSDQLKRLRSWLTAEQTEERLLALAQLNLAADELAELLNDQAAAIRALAARKLAELSDRRAEPVLRELVAQHGAEAAWAYALLLRLGVEVSEPDPITALLADSEPATRIAALESLRHRTAAQALPLLQQAVRDPENLVRWTVGEVAFELAEKPEGTRALSIVRQLISDSDPQVRARAAALLSRLPRWPTPSPGPEPSSSAAEPRPPKAVEPPPVAAADEKSNSPLPRPGNEQSPATATPPAETPAVQIEKLVRAGISSFENKDFKKAQRQMAQALGMCSREHGSGGPCTAFSLDILYRLGQIHEQQNDFPEAMSEYQRVLALAPQVHGKLEIKAAVQEAVRRLAPRLGQVVVPMRTKRGCQEDTIWMRPGTHSIRVNTKFEQIEVKPREVVRVGTCD
jgi:HEAT repeat protein/predicted Ser/Thr protein kinase